MREGSLSSTPGRGDRCKGPKVRVCLMVKESSNTRELVGSEERDTTEAEFGEELSPDPGGWLARTRHLGCEEGHWNLIQEEMV